MEKTKKDETAKTKPNIKELTIKVEGTKWQEALDKAFKEANKKVTIPGFRKGKAPKDVFIKKYGEQSLYMDAADIALNEEYYNILNENSDLEIVAEPDISLKEINKDGVTFNIVFTLKPELKLGKYKGLKVEKMSCEVTKEEVDAAMDDMRKRYAENVLKDGAIKEGDIAIIDFEGFVDDVAFEGGKGENYSLTIGSHTFIPGFEEQLVGLKKGDEKDVKVTFPEDYHSEDLKGKKAIFKVKVNEVKEVVLPDYNEEFFLDLGYEDIHTKKDLEKQIKENIKTHKEADAENKFLDDLLEKAAQNVKVDIPEAMIEAEEERMLRRYEENLKMQGLTLEQFYKFTNTNEAVLKDQMKDEAKKTVIYRLMLEEIAKAEKIEITIDEAKEEAKRLASHYQMKEDEFLNAFGGLDIVKYDLQMRKAIEVLKDNN